MQDDELAESDIRKRAAWLLVMLAVVAGLFVVLSLTLFNSSDKGKSDGQVDDLPTDVPTSVSPSSSAGRSAGASTTTPSTGLSSSSGPVPTPSCPSDATCAVKGDVGGAMSAINVYRALHGKNAVPTTSTSEAEQCALTSGSKCPSSFVWVRVDDLSGSGVVQGVTGFNSSDDLLDDSAKSFAVGWAYNPASKSLSCALLRND
ncbi:hypothetical protein [uncultured Jatrophihabitans sp.]|uniref:hypothetical protein n=1 Tax=uncultured Jatrophihabitans sp. TaxID=1610747 RepID=UPI0035CB559F